MAAPSGIIRRTKERLLSQSSLDELCKKLESQSTVDLPLPPSVPAKKGYTREAAVERGDFLSKAGILTTVLQSTLANSEPEKLQGNIENFIGFAQIPVGVIGPLRINGANVQGDFYVPLATTEGALVASYNRGSLAIGLAGGATSICLTESVSRAPCFSFNNVREAGKFLLWSLDQQDKFQDLVAKRSKRAQLIDVKSSLSGKDLYLIFEYTTGDASGQNMVTLATEEICQFLVSEAPVQPESWYVEGNLSGDKKATMLSFIYTRGKKVVAEVQLPAEVLRKTLHTSAKAMQHYWEISLLGGVQSGSIGAQGHYANALAALFIACGQDAACVSEASVGLTRMQAKDDGSLYVSVTLPNLIVGTVGGGTHLPTARECLEMIGCFGSGRARAFSEICAATVLAGEISIIAALSAGHFAKAHATLGRQQKPSS